MTSAMQWVGNNHHRVRTPTKPEPEEAEIPAPDALQIYHYILDQPVQNSRFAFQLIDGSGHSSGNLRQRPMVALQLAWGDGERPARIDAREILDPKATERAKWITLLPALECLPGGSPLILGDKHVVFGSDPLKPHDQEVTLKLRLDLHSVQPACTLSLVHGDEEDAHGSDCRQSIPVEQSRRRGPPVPPRHKPTWNYLHLAPRAFGGISTPRAERKAP